MLLLDLLMKFYRCSTTLCQSTLCQFTIRHELMSMGDCLIHLIQCNTIPQWMLSVLLLFNMLVIERDHLKLISEDVTEQQFHLILQQI